MEGPTVGLLCRPYAFDLSSILNNPEYYNRKLEVEFTQSCCQKSGCLDKSFTNVFSNYYIINGLSKASVDFEFTVNVAVDENNTGDDPTDGVEAKDQIPNGPALGRISTGISAIINSTEVLDYITYNIYEVECNTGEDETLVLSNTVQLNGNGQPSNYSFSNFKDPIDPNIPYFLVDQNHIGKCFKLECTAISSCGDVSEYSYFTIDPNEYLVDNGNHDALFDYSTLDSGNSKGLTLSGLEIYPNPVVDELNLVFSKELLNQEFTILGIDGTKIMSFKTQEPSMSIDISELNAGMYYIVCTTSLYSSKFVKI